MSDQGPDEPARRARSELAGARAFRHRDFRLFWGSRVAGLFATEMMITTVGWQVYRITARELDLGLIGLAQFAPFAALFLVSGLVADRVSRIRIVLWCIVLQTICATGLFLFTVDGGEAFVPIVVLLVGFGISRAFQQPAQQAILPNLVPKEDFANAVAWAASGFQMARIGGPALAGWLIALSSVRGYHEEPVYAAVVVMFVLATVLAALIRTPVQIVSRDPITIANILGGLKFIASRQVLFGAIALDLFAVLFGGALALLPVYAKDILEIGAEGFGMLRGMVAAGSFCGAVYLSQRPIRRRAGLKLLVAVGSFGVGAIVFGVSEILWLSLVALFVMGLADSFSVFTRQNLVQIITPDQMRGRVSAVSSVFIGASNELGEFESGITAHWWGTVPAVVVGGGVTVAVALGFGLIFPKLRGVDSLEPDDLVRRYRDVPAPAARGTVAPPQRP